MRASIIAAAMLLALASPAAYASCTSQTGSGVLPSTPSTETGSANSVEVAGGLTCTGGALQLLSSATFTVTLTGTTNSLKLKDTSGDTIPYHVYLDNDYSTELSIGQTINLSDVQGLNLLGLFGGPNGSAPLYIRTEAAHFLSAGTYNDALNVKWTYNVCAGIGVGSICIGRDTGTITSTVQLSQQITQDCVFNAPDIHFGSAPLVSQFEPVTQQLQLYCTKGSSYQVGLGPGLHASGGQRYMQSGDNLLAYDIFTPQGRSWGSLDDSQGRTSDDADSNPGPGLGGGPGVAGSQAQGFAYTARIDTNQATPPAGDYSDRIVVTVRF